VVDEPTIDPGRSVRAKLLVVVATAALVAIAFLIGALEWRSGDEAAFDPDARTREIIESELAREGVREFEIRKVHCAKETSTRFECIVTSRLDGTEDAAKGTLECDGTDPSDYCVWRGDLPAAGGRS
jgi:hypothetical protein